MDGHVFISYSHLDGNYVRALVDHFRAGGLAVWTDDGIDYGDRWATVVRGQIDSCSVFVPVMSPHAEASEWVEREIARAQFRGKPILPLLLSGDTFFRLGERHYEDVSDLHMPTPQYLARLRKLAHGRPSQAAPDAPLSLAGTSRGRVVTFHSLQGGAGRTMALANVGWVLAANGKRVLLADCNFTAPGIHRFLRPFLDIETVRRAGTLDWDADSGRDLSRVVAGVNWPFPPGARLDLLPAAGAAAQANIAAGSDLWRGLVDREFVDPLRDALAAEYDYVLIDSPTGVGDVASVCAFHLADVLVTAFTLSDLGIDGAVQVARRASELLGERGPRILPVPMRVDSDHKARADIGVAWARQRLAGFPQSMTPVDRERYWSEVQVPHRSAYTYEEELAVFADEPGSWSTLLSAYEAIAGYITHGDVTTLPEMDRQIRAEVRTRFARVAQDAELVLEYAPQDQIWAEWIGQVLRSAGMRVHEPSMSSASDDSISDIRRLVIVSDVEPPDVPMDAATATLAVHVSDAASRLDFPVVNRVSLVGLDEAAAVEQVLTLVGRRHLVDPESVDRACRFPGHPPVVFNLPSRNLTFTGRSAELEALREKLVSQLGDAGELPAVAVTGSGGVGKTQIAIEYAHRFRNAYDVVWWIAAEPRSVIDSALVDLAHQLNLPAQANASETTRTVMAALAQGTPFRRWLLVFDNAGPPEPLADSLLPRGPGHVVVTSRESDWQRVVPTMPIDVFSRGESTTHLQRRAAALTAAEAEQIADSLGDLPIAVAAAGAWLADTGGSVSDYIDALTTDRSTGELGRTWEPSLKLLEERSPAAYRLLQLCSVLAPEIALDLVYGDEMARVLTPFDPELTERSVRGRLVRQLQRLALVRVDPARSPGGAGGRLMVHRLLQQVVRARMGEEELALTRHDVHGVLAGSRPQSDVDDPGSWPRYRLLWPHLEPSDAVACSDGGVRQLMVDRVRYLWLNGSLATADALAASVEDVWSGRLSEDGTADRQQLRRLLLQLRFNKGNILRDLGMFPAAMAHDEELLAEQQELLGPAHPHTLRTARGFGADLRALGRYSEALRRDQATYASWMEHFGEDHPDTLTAVNNLAASYRLTGDFFAARTLDTTALQRRRQIMGDRNLGTVPSMINLARDLRVAGDYEGSVRLLREALATTEELLGPEVRDAVNIRVNLAVSLRLTGQPKLAADILDAADEQLTSTLGPANPDTLLCRLSRGVNAVATGEVAAAVRGLRAVHESYMDLLGVDHPVALVCRADLAAATHLASTDGKSPAVELARSAAAGLTRVLGPRHPYTLAATMTEALCEPAEHSQLARELIDATAQGFAEVLGSSHPDALRAAVNLGLLDGTENTDAIDSLVRRLGADHPDVTDARRRRPLFVLVDPHPY